MRGCGHVTSMDDIWKFIRLIPDWKRVSTGLDMIYLLWGDSDYEEADGWYEVCHMSSIALASWPENLVVEYGPKYIESHRDLFERLGVNPNVEADEEGWRALQYTEDSARAFQLLHIFLHELGHHRQRMIEGWGREKKPERYAESYAYRMERQIWKRYCEAFHFRPKVGGR